MKKTRKTVSVKSLLRNPIVAAAIIMFILVVATAAFGQTRKIAGKSFASADAAVEALIAATETYDTNALLELLGPNSRDIVQTGEAVRDREVSMQFAKLAREKKNITLDRRSTRAFLEVGEDGYPFPVPLIKQGTKWGFDTEAGRQEIFYRRIGRNELDAIQICRGYVEAQHEYALTKHDNSQVNQYAQKIISSAGKHDGLAWQNADGTWGGTVGENAAKELEKTYTGVKAPYHGYYFKILKGQGAAAPLGAMDFVQKGAMIGGFALVAYPSVYGVTGVKTFMVSHDGVVYEKDLGPDTVTAAAAIELFNPDKTWSPVLDDDD